MLKQDYYNDFFEIGQQKINFSFFELSLPDDDPVYTLKNVMEFIADNKELLTLMETRRSIRKFGPDMVPKDVIDQIIKAGTYAATGMNKQSPIIIAVTNKEMRDKLSRLNAEIMGTKSDPFYGAPVVLIVLADKNWACIRDRKLLDPQGKRGI